MDTPDSLYETLEVSSRACPEVIQAAYHCLLQFNHPDSETAVARLAQINLAYSVLSDPQKRQRYDATISLKDAPPERRGSGVPAPGSAQTGEDPPQESRPFAFRPLG